MTIARHPLHLAVIAASQPLIEAIGFAVESHGANNSDCIEPFNPSPFFNQPREVCLAGRRFARSGQDLTECLHPRQDKAREIRSLARFN